jgi:HEAT repeat protein
VRLPRFRLRVRSLMAAIALVAVGCLGVRVWRDGPENHWQLLKLRYGNVQTRRATALKIRESELVGVGRGLFSGILASPGPRQWQRWEDETHRGERRSAVLCPTLLSATRDSDAAVRANAITALGTLAVFHGSESLKRRVLDRVIEMTHDRNPSVRANAVSALSGSLAGPDTDRVLEAYRTSLNDASIEVRSEAARGSGLLGFMCPQTQPDVLSTLAGLLASRDDPKVRVQAAWGLCYFGQDQYRHPPGTGPDVVPALVTALHDADLQVRRAAARIVSLSHPNATGRISPWAQRKASIIPPLRSAISDNDKVVRDESALALFLLGQRDPLVIKQIEQAAQDGSDQRRRTESLSALEEWQLEERRLEEWQAGFLIGPPEEE